MVLEIYYRCSCGFRTWFGDEAGLHMDENEDDSRPHRLSSVFVDEDED